MSQPDSSCQANAEIYEDLSFLQRYFWFLGTCCITVSFMQWVVQHRALIQCIYLYTNKGRGLFSILWQTPPRSDQGPIWWTLTLVFSEYSDESNAICPRNPFAYSNFYYIQFLKWKYIFLICMHHKEKLNSSIFKSEKTPKVKREPEFKDFIPVPLHFKSYLAYLYI